MDLAFKFEIFGVTLSISILALFLLYLIYDVVSMLIKRVLSDRTKSEYRLINTITLVLVFITVIGHELAHAAVAYLIGHPIDELGVFGLGAYVKVSDPTSLSPLEDFAVSGVGPLFSFLLGVMLLGLSQLMRKGVAQSIVSVTGEINKILGILNVLPIIITDGGGMLDAVMRLFIDSESVRTGVLMVTTAGTVLYWLYTRGYFSKKKENPNPNPT